MNKLSLLVLLSALSLAVLPACQQQSKPATSTPTSDDGVVTVEGSEKDKAEIADVLIMEHSCFVDREIDCWTRLWSQKTDASWQKRRDDGTDIVYSGWNKVYPFAFNLMNNPESDTIFLVAEEVYRKPMTYFFLSEKDAVVEWWQFNGLPDKSRYQTSSERRVMTKEDGKWKVLQVISRWDIGEMLTPEMIQQYRQSGQIQ
jgi:hypothetical protein